MIIDESVAPIIRNIFQWFLSGMNYQTIADRLNAEGVISPQKHMTKVYGREPKFYCRQYLAWLQYSQTS